MQRNTLKIDDEFKEITTKSVDDRKRITLGDLVHDSKRVRMYINKRGEILLIPVVEIPASETWLFQNNKAFENVQKGLGDAILGRITKVNPDKL